MSTDEQLITLTADIVSSHVANNNVAVGDLPNLIERVHSALAGLGVPVEEAPEAKTPVVSVRASVKPDYIVCMECGKQQKTLKRHLQTAHGMTPDQSRTDYGLPQSYPMVAANYSERPRTLANSIGLGRKPAAAKAEAAPAAAEAPKPRRGRKKKTPAEGE